MQFAVRQKTKAELLIRKRAKCCSCFGSPDVLFFHHEHGIIKTTHATDRGLVLKGQDTARWHAPKPVSPQRAFL